MDINKSINTNTLEWNYLKWMPRSLVLFIIDVLLIIASGFASLLLRFEFNIPRDYYRMYIKHIPIIVVIMIVSFFIFKLYSSLWRYASIGELISVVSACIVGDGVIYLMHFFTKFTLPKSFYILFLMITICCVGGIRFTYRALRRYKNLYVQSINPVSRVLIIGAGKAGSMVIKEIINTPDINKKPVAIIDDDRSKHKRRIHGVPVVGTRDDIVDIALKMNINEIIVAIPSLDRSQLKNILNICNETSANLKILPGVYELIDGKVDVKKIRDVDVKDLLGRAPISLDNDGISDYITDKVVLVTGGGGSIGSELCRQIAKYNPRKLIILDIYENNAYDIQNELIRKYSGELSLEVIIASVRDKKRMDNIFKKYRPNIVFHAAAHKHVPLMEANPTEAIKNNVFGTLNVAELADSYGVSRFVLISTDKAVNPTNIMGATKRIAEMLIQSLDKKSSTEFVAVRFGNVLGSNGSVIPLFKRQIENGGPVTVTHPDIIRYFMTIPEAVQLILQAGTIANGGEIFVLDMGKPVRIVDLAKDLIKLSGLKPEADIKIEFTGLRPGEKLYEELLMAEEGLANTSHNKIFIGKPLSVDMDELKKQLDVLKINMERNEFSYISSFMQEIVPTYKKAI